MFNRIFSKRSAPRPHAGRGRALRLYNGNTIWVAALSFAAADELVAARDMWAGIWEDLMAIELSQDPNEVAIRKLVGQAIATVLAWKQLLVLILQDANPSAGIDLDWCRRNLVVLDVVKIVGIFLEENSLTPLVGAAAKAVGDYAGAKWKGLSGAGGELWKN